MLIECVTPVSCIIQYTLLLHTNRNTPTQSNGIISGECGRYGIGLSFPIQSPSKVLARNLKTSSHNQSTHNTHNTFMGWTEFLHLKVQHTADCGTLRDLRGSEVSLMNTVCVCVCVRERERHFYM
jgi:hypothetical protein